MFMLLVLVSVDQTLALRFSSDRTHIIYSIYRKIQICNWAVTRLIPTEPAGETAVENKQAEPG
jgi:hypothetical protein